MNNNKQLNKGDKMRKIVMILGLLSVLATSAEAGGFTCRTDYLGVTRCVYSPSVNLY